MNIIYDVVNELNYRQESSFVVAYTSLAACTEITVKPYVSNDYLSQVFLMIELSNERLHEVVKTDLVKMIALSFRKSSFHVSEMDKNTSLIVVSEFETGKESDKESKVKIEDDPYYFKKYVFSYNAVSERNADDWIKQNKNDRNVVECIQEYVTDTEKFASFKNDFNNEPVYTYFMELITKIPSFPMSTVGKRNLRSVEDYLKEELEKYRSGRKPIEVEKEKVEHFLELEIEELSIEDICRNWK